MVSLRIKRSPKVIAGAAVVGLIAAGGAFAFWTADGTGVGTVTTDTVAAVTVQQTIDAGAAKLTPGGAVVPLKGWIANPNSGIVHINGITAHVGAMPGTGCDITDFLIGGTVEGFDAAPTSTPGAKGSTWSGLNIQLKETGNSQDGCKGRAVPIVFTVN